MIYLINGDLRFPSRVVFESWASDLKPDQWPPTYPWNRWPLTWTVPIAAYARPRFGQDDQHASADGGDVFLGPARTDGIWYHQQTAGKERPWCFPFSSDLTELTVVDTISRLHGRGGHLKTVGTPIRLPTSNLKVKKMFTMSVASITSPAPRGGYATPSQLY